MRKGVLCNPGNHRVMRRRRPLLNLWWSFSDCEYSWRRPSTSLLLYSIEEGCLMECNINTAMQWLSCNKWCFNRLQQNSLRVKRARQTNIIPNVSSMALDLQTDFSLLVSESCSLSQLLIGLSEPPTNELVRFLFRTSISPNLSVRLSLNPRSASCLWWTRL